jgi:hypothetical protein
MSSAPTRKATTDTMTPIRTSLVAALAVAAVLGVGAPAASASTAPTRQFSIPTAFARFQTTPVALSTPIGIPAGSCTEPTGVEGQGRVGGNDIFTCMGAGLSFIGPSLGQVSTVIGPTIISPGFAGNVIVSGGNVNVGP